MVPVTVANHRGDAHDEDRSSGQPYAGYRQMGVTRVEPNQDGTGGVLPDEEQQPVFSVTEAARASGVDRRTIKRKLDAGEFPNAHRQPTGQGPGPGPWLVPLGDLLAAGLTPDVGRVPGPPMRGSSGPPESELRLRAALADAVRRAEVAEALAAERERAIEAQQVALRAFEAGVAAAADGEPDPAGGPDPHHPSGHGEPDRAGGPAGAGAPDETRRHEEPGRPGGGESGSVPAAVPPPARPYPEGPTPPTPPIAPGAPRKPTPPWIPIPVPARRNRWWQRRS